MEWYTLNSNGTPTDPQDYTFTGTTPPTGCSGTDQICAVQASNNGNNEPELDETLKNDMINALHSRTASANVRLKDAL